ncbi:unnamed protein product [Linum tenue]|uniref:KIB1-4 beta-propeller domain-containing protein n=1 Tax=Linum tenue TaxID=586396 RepID=A0AAV0RMQ1_9ROSI|nr:unnamed protein product [Linum tenue]
MLPYCRRNEADDDSSIVGIKECKGEYCRCFHDVVTNEFHHVDFPEAFGKTCRGGGFGWLAFTQETPSGFLINPATRQRIDLPPITTLPGVVSYRPDRAGFEYVRQDVSFSDGEVYRVGESGSWMAHFYVNKIVMSTDPAHTDCVVMGLFESCLGGLALCRPGLDAEWTAVVGSTNCYTDAVFWRDQFYAVDYLGNVDVISYNPGDGLPTKSRWLSTLRDGRYLGINDHYLVENPSGELMLVHRNKDWRDCDFPPQEREELHFDGEEDTTHVAFHGPKARLDLYETAAFKVFELNRDDWERVDSVGDYALFVGGNRASFVSAEEYPRCRTNCIYFTDDYSEGHEAHCHGGYDIGVYDVGKGIVEPFSCRGLYDPVLIWPPPVWVFPSK